MATQFKGDINNDGKIDTLDLMIIFKYKTGEVSLTDEELARADVDGNGAVELADALMIHKHITGEKLIDEVIEY